MTLVSGKDGQVVVGGTPLAEITRWTFETRAATVGFASSASGGAIRRVTGAREGSGEIAFLDSAAGSAAGPLAAGSAVTLVLKLDAARQITVPAIIERLSLETDISGAGPISGVARFVTNGVWS